MTAVLSFFLLSCVNQFAQLYQALIDKDLIEDLKLQLPPLIRKELTCPATGKIILPPPTSASPQLQAHLQETSSAPFGSSNSLLSLSSDAPASTSGLATAATPPRCSSGANASPLALASHHLSDTVLLRQIHPPSSPTHSSLLLGAPLPSLPELSIHRPKAAVAAEAGQNTLLVMPLCWLSSMATETETGTATATATSVSIVSVLVLSHHLTDRPPGAALALVPRLDSPIVRRATLQQR
jgi:hypothetical protein